jgi:hypothetical protein
MLQELVVVNRVQRLMTDYGGHIERKLLPNEREIG